MPITKSHAVLKRYAGLENILTQSQTRQCEMRTVEPVQELTWLTTLLLLRALIRCYMSSTAYSVCYVCPKDP